MAPLSKYACNTFDGTKVCYDTSKYGMYKNKNNYIIYEGKNPIGKMNYDKQDDFFTFDFKPLKNKEPKEVHGINIYGTHKKLTKVQYNNVNGLDFFDLYSIHGTNSKANTSRRIDFNMNMSESAAQKMIECEENPHSCYDYKEAQFTKAK